MQFGIVLHCFSLDFFLYWNRIFQKRRISGRIKGRCLFARTWLNFIVVHPSFFPFCGIFVCVCVCVLFLWNFLIRPCFVRCGCWDWGSFSLLESPVKPPVMYSLYWLLSFSVKTYLLYNKISGVQTRPGLTWTFSTPPYSLVFHDKSLLDQCYKHKHTCNQCF